MKSTALLFLVSVCLVVLAISVTHLALHPHAPVQSRLNLDATTQAILANTDRVEVFRLANFHEDEFRTEADLETMNHQHLGSLDGHTILHVSPPQGRVFAGRLRTALLEAKDPDHSLQPSCFDPGVGFRVWQGRAHVDVAVCFYCSGVDITTKDAGHHETWHTHTDLGRARPALLALCRIAFPDDRALNVLQAGA